ncbi:hypothetical protein BJV78DRAFT_909637 [Lactifluus subvellereus]|nr:hypothetical protein BJV78DRAFT_909637 [Lactifluus subvellereus]
MISIYSLSAVLLLASQSVTAQLAYPDCLSSWSWSFNSLGQNPCAVAAYLQAVCNDGVFTIPPLPPGDSYTGPTGPGDAADLCKCNTVVYSLMSACDACQGAMWLPWETWTRNCTAVDPPTTFLRLIPTGTRVPEWAFLEVTASSTPFLQSYFPWKPINVATEGNLGSRLGISSRRRHRSYRRRNRDSDRASDSDHDADRRPGTFTPTGIARLAHCLISLLLLD